MAENETPQPITREEFEAGVKFYHSPKLQPYDYMETYYRTKEGFIAVSHGNFYCSIQYIADDGFSCIHHIFGHPNEFKVLFKNCLKAQNQ